MLAALAAALVATPAQGALLTPSKVRLVDCQAAVAQEDRFAIFEGEMRSVPRAARMQMRLTLQASTRDRSAWRRVASPGFGVWTSATPGVRRYVFTKRVENLFAPASYRVLVKFRWLDAAGTIVDRDTRRTPVCRQPDQRPNLMPLSLGIEPGSSRDTRTYLIPVVNRGRTQANPFSVTLTVNGQVQPFAAVTGLPAGERTVLSLEAPACRVGSSVSAVVDSDGAVDEADEADNMVASTCF